MILENYGILEQVDMRYIKVKDYDRCQLHRHPSIHVSGSISGMKKLGYWKEDAIIVRCGNYYYNTSVIVS